MSSYVHIDTLTVLATQQLQVDSTRCVLLLLVGRALQLSDARRTFITEISGR